MAAITPHLEQQDDPTETPAEQEWFDRITPEGFEGLGDAGGRLRDEVLETSHAELVRMQWLRQALVESIAGYYVRANVITEAGRQIAVLQVVDENGESVKLTEPAWNPAATRRASVLSWTAKMAAPSFSIPAGPMEFAGSCPGAQGGQSIVSERARRRVELNVVQVTAQHVDLADCVCQFCYAEGGNYAYGTNHATQIIRYMWTREALRSGNFLEVMDWSIKNADFRLQGGGGLPSERHPGKYFRIHDSGDFFSPEYLRQWKELANANPDTVFWAPSRIWATDWGIDAVNQINSPPNNFTIRPSQYMVNAAAPQVLLGPGWAHWSTVFSSALKPTDSPGPFPPGYPYNWDCQAYRVVGDEHNCRRAAAPDYVEGCRACWNHPDLSVNYTFH